MFKSVTTFVAANVSRSHFRSLVVALSVVACLCQATAAQEPYIGQIYFLYYSGEPAQRHNMISETGVPVRAKVELSSTAQTAMNFQLKQSPLTHTSKGTAHRNAHSTLLDSQTGQPFDWTRFEQPTASTVGRPNIVVRPTKNSHVTLNRGFGGPPSPANRPTSIPVVPNGGPIGFSNVRLKANTVRPAVPAMPHNIKSR